MTRKSISHFINNYAKCLVNSNWLGFITPIRYDVKKPKAEENPRENPGWQFRLMNGDNPTAFICVYPEKWGQPGQSLYIYNIWTRKSGYNLGREMLRRTVLFAVENECQEITTSYFTSGGATFWIGHGFDYVESPTTKVKMNFGQMSRREIWEWARNSKGVRFPLKADVSGRLNLHDREQMEYCFDRLKIPEGRLILPNETPKPPELGKNNKYTSLDDDRLIQLAR